MFTTIPDRRRNRSRPRPPLPAVMEALEGRLLLSVTPIDVPFLEGALAEAPAAAEIHKLMVAGDPNGDPADSPTLRVDPNTTASPYAGVRSLWVDAPGPGGYIGSGTAIGPNHVLTAAHMLDLRDNGKISVKPQNVVFILNFGSDYSHEIPASALYIHPDWTGFNNPSVNDDLAIIELSQPLPPDVPIYPLSTSGWTDGEAVTLVGYGQSGDGVSGYSGDASFSVKRTGANETDLSDPDDEGGGAEEVFAFDFDGGGWNMVGSGSLGNDIETTLGGGDSGGPAFRAGTGGLEVYGVNTFGFSWIGGPSSPLFGSGAGGIVVAPYVDWIQSIGGGASPTPGISVAPTSGLETREDGTTAAFDVVLDTVPTADVTIALSSSDTTEGTVSSTPLTFTASDWDTPQTVMVTGVNDDIEDGDQAYSIVTAAATSGDTDYDGLNAADVSVTNLDNEAPAEVLAITKATYNSKKKQLKIEATSSLGGDTGLRATVFVNGVESSPQTMKYSARTNNWSVTFKSLATEPDKVRVYSTTPGVWVEKSDIGDKSSPVATAYAVPTAYAMPTAATTYAMPTADTAPEAVADSPILLFWAVSTPAPADARKPADVSTPRTVADLPPLAVYSATTGFQQSPPPQRVDLVPGTFEDAPADSELAAETDLEFHLVPLDGELLDNLALPL